MKIGIVGLPNVGKSTLFQALTKKEVEIADYPFTTIKPNLGVLPVPDERFEKLVKLVKPEASFPAVIEVLDIAGLVKGAHKGEGLGNEFLSHIHEVDAVLFLIGDFKPEHNPQEQIAILKEELALKDPKLSAKPALIVSNVRSSTSNISISAKEELEISALGPKAAEELGFSSRLPELIREAYRVLDLISFYTIKGGREARAWAVPKGTLAPQAGGSVHSDFEKKFIRAEVISVEKLLEAEGWSEARKRGLIKTGGRDYVVQDGDVIEFKI